MPVQLQPLLNATCPSPSPSRSSLRKPATSILLAWTLALAACGGGQDAVDPPTEATSAAEPSSRTLSAKSNADGTSVNVTTITLNAWSTQADNIGAVILLRYNGLVIAREEVRASSTEALVFRVPTRIDGGVLDVVFTNATYPNGVEARRLSLQSVVVNGRSFSSTGPGVVYDTGHGEAAFDGLSVLPGTTWLQFTGALRFPMLPASDLGAQTVSDSSSLAADPGPYVDFRGGSDTYSGVAGRPFKTLAKLASVKLLPGENIHLRCGSVWRESLELGVSNLADGTQVVPYGDCGWEGPPHVSGADRFDGGWVKQGNIWSRALPANTPKITQLLVGFTSMRLAQWPNAGDPLVLVDSVSGPTRFTIGNAQAAALSGQDLGGAGIVLRTQPWRAEARQIAPNGVVGNQVTLSAAPESTLQAGGAFVISGKRWMLDAPGEFFHDTVAQRLYLIPAAADAALDMNNAVIEGSVRDVAVDLRERRGLVVRGLRTRMARGDGIRLTNAPEAQVSTVESTVNGSAGIRLMQWNPLPAGAGSPRIEGNDVAVNGEYGVDARYVSGARIIGNRVAETGIGVSIGPVGAGIAGGPAARIENNVVSGSGYAGISFSGLQGSVVSGNEISRYCLRLSDCGGIYTWSSQSDISPQQGAWVEGNRVHTATAVTAGSAAWGHDLVVGIYLDDHSQRVTVRNNFLHAMPIGVFVHNGALNTVEGNRVWMANQSAIAVSMDRYDADWSFGNVIRNNEAVPFTTANGAYPQMPSFTSAYAFQFTHVLSGEAALATGRNEFRGNRVVQLHGETTHHAAITGPGGQRFVDSAAWTQLNPGEPLLEQPITYSSYWVALGPEKLPYGEFDGGLSPWGKHWNWQIAGFDLQPLGNQVGCNGPCIRMTSADSGDMIYSPPFTMRTGVLHMYRWTATAGAVGATVNYPYISRYSSPWDPMNDWQGFTGRSPRTVKPNQTLKYEAFFVPKSGDPARVNVQLETLGVPVAFDAISVREVLTWLSSGPSEWVAPVVAPRDASRTVASCGDMGLPADCIVAGLDGVTATLPFTIAANEQRLLLWANSPYRKY